MNINKKIFYLILISFTLSKGANSQKNEFEKTDTYVKTLGALDTLNMGTIANLLTQKFTDKKQKARAIYFWITNNITYETKVNKAIDSKYNSSDIVLKNRKAGSLGYATLFQDMCSVAGIRCLTADGFFKRTTDEINEKNTEINHSWDVIQLGQSPEEWFYVDAACGSGLLDKKGTTFTKSFDDAYFFANKVIFNHQHYPDNNHWQLSSGPKNKKNFYELPIIKNGAYLFSVDDFSPNNGLIKTKVGKSINFNLSVSGEIKKISLLIEENKKQKVKTIDNAIITNNKIKFDYIFENEGSFITTMLINDKEILQYLIEVE